MSLRPEDLALGRALREIRERKGISQEDAAHLAGLHRAQYGRYEQGNNAPSFVMVMRIASAFGVGVADIAAAVERELTRD
jgi:transcriptional regulator with XRE-family HTH domain